MAKVNRDFLEPEVAVSLARRELAEFEANDPSSLAGYLPSLEVDDIEYEIEVGGSDGMITAANWRMFNGNTTSEKWGEGAKSRGRLMPLSRNFTLDEETRLRMRNDASSAIERESAKLVRRATRAIALQINYQRANALANGKVEIKGSGGLRQEVDFGRRDDFDTVAPTLFSDPGADPLAQIEAYADLYEEENGFRPEQVMMSSEVRRIISTHPAVVLGATGNPDKPRASVAELQALFDQYDLPTIVNLPTNKVKVDNLDTGETEVKSLFEKDSLLFTPRAGDPMAPEASIFGRTMWGRTLSGDTEDFGLANEHLPGIVAAVIEDGWPSHLEVIADAIAMPVVFNPNYTLKAKVL